MEIYKGDCLRLMPELKPNSVDLVIADLPYGTTQNLWDEVINLEALWKQYNRAVKINGAIVLFADEPFTSKLIVSNLKYFKQRITWDKDRGGGFLNAKKMLLKQTEDICVFYRRPPTYNPQMREAKKDRIRTAKNKGGDWDSDNYGRLKDHRYSTDYDPNKRYPTNLLKFPSNSRECNPRNRMHPTQKPVGLIEYLIKTYSNEGDTVMDNTMGSGSTGIACLNTGRLFIGIESDETYFEKAKNRIAQRNIELINQLL